MDKKEFAHPLISIVIPVYNVENYLQNTLSSVKMQNYTHWELILVDDGSTDTSPEICDSFAAFSEKTTVVHCQNGGQASARNIGLNIAKGDYIYFLDSDDVIQPNTLQCFVDTISKYGEQDLIFTKFQRVRAENIFKEAESDEGIELFKNRKDLQRAFLLRTHVILAPGTLYRIKWLKSNKLTFQSIPYSEDQLFIWHALLFVDSAIYIRRSLYNYLDRPGSIMTSTKAKSIVKSYPSFQRLEEEYSLSQTTSLDVQKYLLPRWVFGIARSGSKLTSYSEYINLLNKIEADKHLMTLESFPDVKVKLFLIIRKISKKLFYILCKLT